MRLAPGEVMRVGYGGRHSSVVERQLTTRKEATLADNLFDLGLAPLQDMAAMDAAHDKWAEEGFPIPSPDAQSLADPTETS